MNIKDQIAAARALADAASLSSGVRDALKCISKVYEQADALERACELLEDAADNSLYPGKRAIVRAFLAGEVNRAK